MADLRIKDLPESASLEAGDYVAVDSAGSGTRRFLLNDLIKNIGAPEYVVTIDGNDVADKTFSEITTAIANGYVPVVKRNDIYYHLSQVTSTGVTFSNNDDLTNRVLIRITSGGVVVTETPANGSMVANDSGVSGETITQALDNVSYTVSSMSDRISGLEERVSDSASYKSGDEVDLRYGVFPGILFSSGSGIRFFISLPKSVDDLTPSVVGEWVIRHGAGGSAMFPSDVSLDDIGTVSYYKNGAGVMVDIVLNEAITSHPANAAVVLYGDSGNAIRFS